VRKQCTFLQVHKCLPSDHVPCRCSTTSLSRFYETPFILFKCHGSRPPTVTIVLHLVAASSSSWPPFRSTPFTIFLFHVASSLFWPFVFQSQRKRKIILSSGRSPKGKVIAYYGFGGQDFRVVFRRRELGKLICLSLPTYQSTDT